MASALSWLDPWHLANHRLREAMVECAPHVHGQLLDMGCGAKPYRDIFTVDGYVGVDLPGAAGTVDAFASVLALPFADASFDTVLSNEVLEHVPEPGEMMAEAARVLKPGGMLVLTTPQTWGLHHEPWDFYRFTPYGLHHLATKHGFVVERIFPTSGFWVTFAQRFSDSCWETWGSKRKGPIARRVLRVVCAVAMLSGVALERLFGRRGDTLDNVLIARRAQKPD